MTSDRDVAAHLANCFDATYRALGELAPLMGFDPCVVCAHEMSRSFGEVALVLREYTGLDPSPLAIIDAVLRRSWSEDPSGTLTLYALAIVVGPRLLVSLRDALEATSDDVARAVFSEAQMVTVGQVRRVVGLDPSGTTLEESRWNQAAQDLGAMVESDGNADSFGISR